MRRRTGCPAPSLRLPSLLRVPGSRPSRGQKQKEAPADGSNGTSTGQVSMLGLRCMASIKWLLSHFAHVASGLAPLPFYTHGEGLAVAVWRNFQPNHLSCLQYSLSLSSSLDVHLSGRYPYRASDCITIVCVARLSFAWEDQHSQSKGDLRRHWLFPCAITAYRRPGRTSQTRCDGLYVPFLPLSRIEFFPLFTSSHPSRSAHRTNENSRRCDREPTVNSSKKGLQGSVAVTPKPTGTRIARLTRLRVAPASAIIFFILPRNLSGSSQPPPDFSIDRLASYHRAKSVFNWNPLADATSR